MPLRPNKSTTQKTMMFKNMDTHIKENYSLSCDRVTVFTQVSSYPAANFIPEFVFKGKGTRTKLNPPEGIRYSGVIVDHIGFSTFCKRLKICQTITETYSKERLGNLLSS